MNPNKSKRCFPAVGFKEPVKVLDMLILKTRIKGLRA